MRFYRVYVIDTTDNIQDTRFIQAVDDQDAVAKAGLELEQAAAIEIWDQHRLVVRHSPISNADPVPFVLTSAEECSIATLNAT
jgi:hypothetical protein